MDPELYPESADDWETEVLDKAKDELIEIKDRAYGKPSAITEIFPLKFEDSAEFSKQLWLPNAAYLNKVLYLLHAVHTFS